MRLASLDDSTRDGALVVIDNLGKYAARATSVAKSLQQALDSWETLEPRLRQLQADLEAGKAERIVLADAKLLAPLPRAYEWIDASAYLNHIILVRKARGADLPERLKTDPLVYQGGSGVLQPADSDIELPDPSWGLDFEAEVCVILGDVPRGTRAVEADRFIHLLTLANDVTFRNLIPDELKKGFGFFNSKPATAFAPFAVTKDELGDSLRGGRVHLRLRSLLNTTLMGDPEAGEEMHFSFLDLIEHITKTRSYTAGTVLGSGTVSNADPARGVSCLAELRMRELLERGEPHTEFLKAGDRVQIEMLDRNGRNLFGSIDQRVVAVSGEKYS